MKLFQCNRSFPTFTILIVTVMVLLSGVAFSGEPHSAFYSAADNQIFWFIQVNDTHIGTRGTQDSNNLRWLVTEGKNTVNPEFIVVAGDLTDSTDGNWLGYPNGPYQSEWDEYKSILSQGNNINYTNFYDLPGNHDAYNDQNFNYYRANSIQGQATGSTQVSWTRDFGYGKYHFLGINTADNTGAPFSLSWPWGDYAGLDANELSFIQSDLDSNDDADLTFVFGHHPVTDTGDDQDTWLYYGASEFIGLLDQYGASLYGYGHTHRYSEDLFEGDSYTGYMSGNGIVYLNIGSLGKSSDNNFSVIAVDCNGISTKTQTMGVWPLVMITAPVDRYLGDSPNLVLNPYSYSIPNAAGNPIRALVFDKNTISLVQYRIDAESQWYPMQPVTGNPNLWEADWDASGTAVGEHTIQVQTVGSTTRTDIISVMVFSDNEPPVADNQNVGTNEDTAKSIVLTASDSDGDPLTFQVASPPAHGSLSGTAPDLTYTPAADYHGGDSFTFRASDGKSFSNTATVSITITSINDVPVAGNDSYAVDQGQLLTVPAPGVLANDTDIDGDALTAAVVHTVNSGTLSLSPNGGFNYTPDSGFHGADSFTYKANDGLADSSPATVTITVNQVVSPDQTPPDPDPMTWADPPHALDSTSISMTATEATDENGVEYLFECVLGACHDSLWQASVDYTDTGLTPNTSYGYTVKARDKSVNQNETAASDEASATTAAVPNNPPHFTTDPINKADATVGVPYAAALQNDADDPDGDTLTFSLVGEQNWLSVDPNGNLSGTPGTGDLGPNQFTVRVTDSAGAYDEAVLNITVNPAGEVIFNAVSENTTRGTVTESIADTYIDDGNYEELTEEIKSRRWSLLDHTWTFNVSGQASVVFKVQAYHEANTEGDDFVFAYSLDNATFTDMVVVRDTSDSGNYQSFALPAFTSGTIYVRVTDTDSTKGNTGTDTLYVDDMHIVTSAVAGMPDPASEPSPPNGATGVSTNPTLLWTAGANATSHDVYLGVDDVNLPPVSSGQSGNSYSPAQLQEGTTYYWRIDEVNDNGTIPGAVWSFTTVGGGSCTPTEVYSSVSLSTVRGAAGASYGQATVTIVDNCGSPVMGASVTGLFTGDFSSESTKSGSTDANGVVVFTTTTSVKKPTFGFEVDNVKAEGLTYMP